MYAAKYHNRLRLIRSVYKTSAFSVFKVDNNCSLVIFWFYYTIPLAQTFWSSPFNFLQDFDWRRNALEGSVTETNSSYRGTNYSVCHPLDESTIELATARVRHFPFRYHHISPYPITPPTRSLQLSNTPPFQSKHDLYVFKTTDPICKSY